MKVIAVIDDDVYIGDMLEELLRREGYGVLRAYSGTEALYLVTQHSPDLILLDLMLPGLSGEAVLEKIKEIPIIVVSAKSKVEDKVSLLLGGAVDYITKPFDTKELLARVAVALRNMSPIAEKTIRVGDLKLLEATREVFAKEVLVKLTRTEYAILRLLMKNPRQVVTKSIILDQISVDTPDCTESSLKIHISNIRKKLREAAGEDYIEAVWGIGFKLREVVR